jgi:16S rRNA (cytosine1402-N4)-methyltransferase
MTGRGDGPTDAAGGPARHVPVLLEEVRSALEPCAGGWIVDGTFGAGGYTKALLDAHPETRVLAIDRDPHAIEAGSGLAADSGRRLVLARGRFGDLEELVSDRGIGPVAGVVLDIGVSSMQIDQAERGFSFRADGPLDMRMEQAGQSAADLVNEGSEALLADVFYHYGEERRARAVARAVIEARRKAPITTTRQMADLVAAHVRAEPGGAHPATRVFQALRIAVNDELGELLRALEGAERVLAPGGRLVVVTFHSLEDRIVKQFMAGRAGRLPAASRHMPQVASEAPSFRLVAKGVVAPGDAEIARNSRARSAKLRAAERTEAPAQEGVAALEALASLPESKDQRGRRR